MRKNKDLHICVFYWDLGLGGVQRKIADIVTKLKKDYNDDCKISILLNKKNLLDYPEPIFESQIANSGAVIDYCPDWKWRRFHFPYTLYAILFAWRKRPDVILSFLHRHGVIAIITKIILFWRKIKVVHGQDVFLSKSLAEMYAGSVIEKYWWNILVRLFYPLADVIIVPAVNIKTDLVNKFSVSDKKISVIHNWVKSSDKARGRKIYDLIYVGRLSAQKLPYNLIDVISEIKLKNYAGIKLCILGHGEMYEDLVEYVHRKELGGNVYFLGTRKNVYSFLKKSKVFILTSGYEGEPISVLEAMACGLPVCSLSYPGAKDLIKKGTGFVCQNNNQLAKKIRLLLDNPGLRKDMGNKAKDYINKYHSFNNLEKFVSYL